MSASEIRLIQGDIYELSFEPESFDFIYSLGVFGHAAELTTELCVKFHRWLSPGGRVYFDAIEDPGRRRSDQVKDSIKKAVYPIYPPICACACGPGTAMPVIYHERYELELWVPAAGFEDFAISINTGKSPLWRAPTSSASGGSPRSLWSRAFLVRPSRSTTARTVQLVRSLSQPRPVEVLLCDNIRVRPALLWRRITTSLLRTGMVSHQSVRSA